MSFFWDANLPIEQRIGNLVGDVIWFVLVASFAWAYISLYI
jgi:hypothetical protein